MKTIKVKINCGKEVCGKCNYHKWSNANICGVCTIFNGWFDLAVESNHFRLPECIAAEINDG